jgi:uncharacterized membrane protein
MADAKSNDNLMGAVAYLLGPVTGILLLLTEKKNPFIRFHAMQSTIVFIGTFIASLVPVIGWLIMPIVTLVLWVFLMWKAFSGEKYKLPYVGDFAEAQLKKLG